MFQTFCNWYQLKLYSKLLRIKPQRLKTSRVLQTCWTKTVRSFCSPPRITTFSCRTLAWPTLPGKVRWRNPKCKTHLRLCSTTLKTLQPCLPIKTTLKVHFWAWEDRLQTRPLSNRSTTPRCPTKCSRPSTSRNRKSNRKFKLWWTSMWSKRSGWVRCPKWNWKTWPSSGRLKGSNRSARPWNKN